MSKLPEEKGIRLQIVIFLHLPKAAGSTLGSILERQYGQDRVLKLYDSFYGEELEALSPDRLERLRAIMGHFYFGAHQYSSKPATYVTFLRDPVKRVSSHYRYVQGDPGHYLYPVAQQHSLKEYVLHCGKAEPNNDQTRLLAGKDCALEDGTWSIEMLPAAKRNLKESFSTVGVVEEFDRSLILMKRVLGWRIPFYVKQNVSRPHKKDGGLDPDTVRVIQAHNQLDADLYVYAKSLMSKQLRDHGEALERELRLFNLLNSAYGMLNGMSMKVVDRS